MYLLLVLFVPLMGLLKFGPPIFGFGADSEGGPSGDAYLLEAGASTYYLMEDGNYLLKE